MDMGRWGLDRRKLDDGPSPFGGGFYGSREEPVSNKEDGIGQIKSRRGDPSILGRNNVIREPWDKADDSLSSRMYPNVYMVNELNSVAFTIKYDLYI